MTFTYLNGLGRESLHQIIHSRVATNWLLPDLLCPLVYDIFFDMKAPGAKVDFYKIGDGFEPEWPEERYAGDLCIDGVFIVNYFGHEWPHKDYPGVTYVHDAVWSRRSPVGLSHPGVWFNSFRKLLPVPEGSLVVSTMPLVESTRRFNAHLLVIALANDWHREWQSRRENWAALAAAFDPIPMMGPEYPKFFAMAIDGRDEVIAKLKKDHDVSLPRPWRDVHRMGNPLYDRLMCVPVDSQFMPDGPRRIIDLLAKEMGK